MRSGRWRLTATRCTVGSCWGMSSPEVRGFPWLSPAEWLAQLADRLEQIPGA